MLQTQATHADRGGRVMKHKDPDSRRDDDGTNTNNNNKLTPQTQGPCHQRVSELATFHVKRH